VNHRVRFNRLVQQGHGVPAGVAPVAAGVAAGDTPDSEYPF
jgi:hypothetical protein